METAENYLITGGAGFIGSHLTRELLARGKRVLAIDDLSTGRLENVDPFRGHPHYQLAIDTIANEGVLDRLASEASVIVHLAAAVGVRLIVEQPVHTIETNVGGTERVLRAARRYRAKVLLASTSEVYGKGNRVPFRETDDLLLGPTSRSRWAYAASKIVDEFLGLAYSRQYGVPVVVFRLFNTVGPGQTGRYGMVIPRFVAQALAGEALTIFGDGSQRRCFCEVRDAVRAILGLADSAAAVGGIFNIGGDEEVSIRELAERVLARTGSSSRLTYTPYEEAYAPGFEDIQRRVPDTTAIRALLGWEPRYSLDATLDAVRDALRGGTSP
ncbi:MAG: NAD-dependent epimerase/dehydratase family protein [Thermoanaerobaculia bacterium]